MAHVRWTSKPELRRPALVVAFAGWNDAGDAATTAATHLRDATAAQPVASIDAEEFFDFTRVRPTVRLDDDGQRTIDWPETALFATEVNGRGLVVLLGTEPQLRWHTFCDEVVAAAGQLGVQLVLTLGALLAEVPHSRPVSVIGTSADDELNERLGLTSSSYEGPTGITGVLGDACRRAGIVTGSLWAAVPSYVPGAPSPKAALALVERTSELLDVSVNTTGLQIAAAAYERQVNNLVEADEDMRAYVTQLEERADSDDDEPETIDSLVEDIERFLRDQPDE